MARFYFLQYRTIWCETCRSCYGHRSLKEVGGTAVHSEKIQGKEAFVCDACGLAYLEKDTANECEAFCKMHNACSIIITAKAIQPLA